MNVFLWAAFHPGAQLLLDGWYTKAMPWMHSNQPSIPLRGVFVLGYQSSTVMGDRCVNTCEATPSMALTFSPSWRSIDWFVYSNCTAYPLSLTTIWSVLLWYTHSTLLCPIVVESIVYFVTLFSGEGGMDIYSRCLSIDASPCWRKYKGARGEISLMWKRDGKATTEKMP